MKRVVLVADGDAGWRDLSRRLFATLGYGVETATDGLDCLGKLQHLMPGVLVLDLALRWGGADGILAWLREEGREWAVVLTGDESPQPVSERFLASPRVVAYFRKPLQLSALLEVVRSHASRPATRGRRAWTAGKVEVN